MLKSAKLNLAVVILLLPFFACSESPKTTEKAAIPESSPQTIAKSEPVVPAAAPPPAAETPPPPPEKKTAEYMRIGKFDPSGKYSLAMKKDTTDVVIADQRGMITPIPFDSSKYSDVIFSDPSSTGLILIVANKSESESDSDLGPTDYELYTFKLGTEKVEKLSIKLPGKQLLAYALAEDSIALASGNKTKKGLELKITVTDKSGKKLRDYSAPPSGGEAYELVVSTKGDVFALIDFGDKKRSAQPLMFRDGKPVTKLRVPTEITTGGVTLDSMDTEGNIVASRSTKDLVEVLKFNPLKGDGKVEKMESKSLR
jgi:hypothetical protein